MSIAIGSKCFDGGLVWLALVKKGSPFTISNLVGCHYDDSESCKEWVISFYDHSRKEVHLSAGDKQKKVPQKLITEGVVHIGDTASELISYLEQERTRKEKAQCLTSDCVVNPAESKTHFRKQRERLSTKQTDRSNAMRDLCAQRSIDKLYHFTFLENLAGIIDSGLISRKDLLYTDTAFVDQVRNDHRLDCISISISFPNSRLFDWKRREFPDKCWCVIALESRVLWELPCLFLQGNAASSKFNWRSKRDNFRGAQAFEMLFSGDATEPVLDRKYPTDEQAEVQVESSISLSYVSSIKFRNFHELSSASRIVNRNSAHIKYLVTPFLFRSCDSVLGNVSINI